MKISIKIYTRSGRWGLILFLFIASLFAPKALFAYSGSCSFVGQNTSIALQQTQALIANIKILRDSENCKINDQTLAALANVSKYMEMYKEGRSQEHELVGINAELEQLDMAYRSASDADEKSYWMNKIISAKTSQIVTRAQMAVSRGTREDELLTYSLQNIAGQISTIVQSAATLNDCFMSKPELASMVLSGIVNVTGAVASVVTVNPIWGGVGGIVGNLITSLTTFIIQYRWEKYIKLLNKRLVYHSFMCMVEMQSNFYCEKSDEIAMVKKIIGRLERGGGAAGDGEIWKGIDVQANSVPVIQNWIKTLHRGLPPSSGSDAQEQNELLAKVNAAEMIQNQILGSYKKIEEQFNEGSGEKLNIITNAVAMISMIMGGTFPQSSGMGFIEKSAKMDMGNPYALGQLYFTARFMPEVIAYVLITPPDGNNFENYPQMPPQCPGGGYCDKLQLFIDYVKQKYGVSDRFTDDVLGKILSVVGRRIEFIFSKVNADIDNDLIRQRIRDPEVLLSKAKNADFPYKLSAEKGLVRVNKFLDESIELLKKYLHYPEGADACKDISLNSGQLEVKVGLKNYLGLKRNKEATPVQMRLACETKALVQEILLNLNNNSDSARARISRISKLLRFSTDRTLYFLARISEVLKTDLNVRVELGLLSPREEEMMVLREKDMILKLAEEQETQNVNYNQAIKERESAQAVVRDNLSVFVSFEPLRSLLVSVTSEWGDLAREDSANKEYLSKFGEACAILLALPFGTRQGLNWNRGGEDFWNTCRSAYAESEWNVVRRELNLPVVSELDVNFRESYYGVLYPERMCAYRNYLRKNVIYATKKRYQQDQE
ncbi:MAG: hypothetical protein HQK50_04575 [Oligoflexia bacterium]|nr:hypothetical protein [Oligoflexia bacterium]